MADRGSWPKRVCHRPCDAAVEVVVGAAGRQSGNEPIECDKCRYWRRSRIEIMFGSLKDRRRVAPRCDRSPTAFFAAIALVATVIFHL